jgi:hypothetical protein
MDTSSWRVTINVHASSSFVLCFFYYLILVFLFHLLPTHLMWDKMLCCRGGTVVCVCVCKE